MKFKKYQCLENDFIITEDEILNIKDVCDSHKGVGADGLIIKDKENFLFFNKDGTKAKFCGNGVRCVAKYLLDNNLNKEFLFEKEKYDIVNDYNLFKLSLPVSNYKKIKRYYLVDSKVKHLVILDKPSIKLAAKLFLKYDCNITFYFNDQAKTYEKGVGFTRGCGSGLISIMSVLYKEFNINSKTIYSGTNKSFLEVKNNNIYLESEVHFVYEGEIEC